MKIYFMRHGETDWNKERRLQGQSDIPLNNYGVFLAKETAAALSHISFDRIYSSPLTRAFETASIMAENRNIKVITDDRLLELSFGEGEGLSLSYIHSHPESELYNFIHNPCEYIPAKGGETLDNLFYRCGLFLRECIFPLENSCKNILVVGHGALIRGMIYHMNGRSIADFWSVTHKNCSVTISQYEDDHFQLLEEAKIFYKENKEADW
ncbi:MAG: histidine phosphatase family protein [Lachnospiraceae bacterium]|nr:histidine phosphatase family protein [Lachnospiraceae bacterium]